MKSSNDIKKILSEWSSHYEVPEDYFADFKQKQQKKTDSTKHFSLTYSRTTGWVAASLLLLLGLLFALQYHSSSDVSTDNEQVQYEGKDLFSDLSEDEIIEYFLDNEEFINEL